MELGYILAPFATGSIGSWGIVSWLYAMNSYTMRPGYDQLLAQSRPANIPIHQLVSFSDRPMGWLQKACLGHMKSKSAVIWGCGGDPGPYHKEGSSLMEANGRCGSLPSLTVIQWFYFWNVFPSSSLHSFSVSLFVFMYAVWT